MTKPDTPPSKGAGRPFKGVGRTKVTFQVEIDLLTCLDHMTEGKKNQRSEVLNRVLTEARSRGLLKDS